MERAAESDILARLRRDEPAMPRKLAAAARYALGHPDRIALQSMRLSADAAGVTSPTMLRLARRMGYPGFPDFKAAVQSAFLERGFSDRAGALRAAPGAYGDRAVADQVLAAAEANLRATRAGLRRAEIETAADMLRAAPTCWLVASTALFWLAALMRTTGGMALPNLRLVGLEHAVAAEGMVGLDRRDLVIGFGIAPVAERTVAALRFARAEGARVVAVTDSPGSPVADCADLVLSCATEGPHYYPSVASLVATIEALLATAVARDAGVALERVRRVEAVRRNSGLYHTR